MLGLLQLATSPSWFSLDPDAPPDLLGGFLICLFTLSVFSFLYRDNAFYKLAEHVFIGVGTAWYTLEFYDSGVLKPLFEYIESAHLGMGQPSAAPFDMGGYPISPEWAIFWRMGAVALSIMLLTRLVTRNAWISRWPLAMMVGIYAALKMTGETQARLVQQIREAIIPLWGNGQTGVEIVGNIVLVVGLLAVLGHFVFTYRRNAVLRGASRVGIIVLMLAFGSRFGFTVLGRIALLIKRVSELHGYAGDQYSLAGVPAGVTGTWLDTALTPPFLVAALIITVLLLAKMTGREQPAAPPT